MKLFNALAMATKPINVVIPNELQSDPLIKNRITSNLEQENKSYEQIASLINKLRTQIINDGSNENIEILNNVNFN